MKGSAVHVHVGRCLKNKVWFDIHVLTVDYEGGAHTARMCVVEQSEAHAHACACMYMRLRDTYACLDLGGRGQGTPPQHPICTLLGMCG